MSISFNVQEISFGISNPRKTKAWILDIIKREGHQAESISYIFCSDEYLWNLNKSYLNHNTYTDILTFDYSEGKVLSGDIFISIDRVEENAKNLKVSFDEELRRVMIHGILHMTGLQDKTTRQKEAMRKKEEACLSLFAKN